ncbi:MAG: Gfo/Idh/MocA family oxidoreductase [Bacteroidia bacterium]|nr:Gfo/Idh/MocA family oxidoreductase [Bacteroidia bacterium]MDW8133475.1 Gfo/Idh/MocA family oxidoreductase [Bacteroidia bacterium]
MSSPVRLGIVGLGYMGRLHLQKALQSPRTQVVALFDTSPTCHIELQEKGLPVVDDYETLLAKVDAVIIASPTPTHVFYAAAALRAQKHILIEKPVVTTPEELDLLLRLQEEMDVVTVVGHIERFNPAFRSLWPLRHLFWQYSFERIAPWVPRGSEVSVVLDLLIHDLDLFWALTEGRIAEMRVSAYRSHSDTPDSVQLYIDLVGGRGASFLVSRVAPHKRRRIVAHGPSIWAEADLLSRTAQFWCLTPEMETPLPSSYPEDALSAELEHFLSCIQEGRESFLSLAHVYPVMEWTWQVAAMAESRLLFSPR